MPRHGYVRPRGAGDGPRFNFGVLRHDRSRRVRVHQHMRGMSPLRIAAAAYVAASIAACASPTLTAEDRRAIADSLARQVKAASDLSQPDVVKRMLSLYP